MKAALTLLCVQSVVLSGAAGVPEWAGGGVAVETSQLGFSRMGRSFLIEHPVSADIEEVEVRIVSRANDTIAEYDEVALYEWGARAPHSGMAFDAQRGMKHQLDAGSQRKVQVLVVDVAIVEGMEAVLAFDVEEPGGYCINGDRWRIVDPNQIEARIPASEIEHWGNALVLNPQSNSIQSFYLAGNARIKDSKASYRVETLRDDWRGSLSLYDASTDELIASALISRGSAAARVPAETSLTREAMVRSLVGATEYLLGCKNLDATSPSYGGYYSYYDLSAKTRLGSGRPCAWGGAVSFLIEASRLPGVELGVSRVELKAAAVDLGMASLRHQIRDPEHPACGIVSRKANWHASRDNGFDTGKALADSMHLVGVGWMPLFQATANEGFLEASERVVEASAALSAWHSKEKAFQGVAQRETSWDEASILASSNKIVGLAELYSETGQGGYKEGLERELEVLLDAFPSEDDPAPWMRTSVETLGNCVDGLLRAHSLFPERDYLQRSVRVAELVLAFQAADGAWPERLEGGNGAVAAEDRATAMWAYLFMKLYKATGDRRYLDTGSKAIERCRGQQNYGEDAVARGGIVGPLGKPGTDSRHDAIGVDTETVSYYGKALLEALSLDEWRH
ncbi:hypothetical protein [Pelagicoccus sp. SDUM812005]|uniref:hypothetical protein n=1 Tax=Pelagicoccus sp. SDUM812005 TaxID=3041257 RepID=UPI00280E8FBC|nr:hypothetical protein [Pelagicoccus sp. SDUM812005]MDQ8182919.1 hypothetical protein [Pelagicoccus sp. SDUM812005]